MVNGKLVEIEFVFENVESATVQAEDIDYMRLGEVSETDLTITQPLDDLIYNSLDEISEWLVIQQAQEGNTVFTDNVIIKLKPTADKRFEVYGELSEYTLFERLKKWPDIVHINVTVKTQEGTTFTERYAVYWSVESEDINSKQRVTTDEDGMLLLSISKT